MPTAAKSGNVKECMFAMTYLLADGRKESMVSDPNRESRCDARFHPAAVCPTHR